ncbi:unnamed protein product [Acanthoscelides obtectus]|uniref:Uncharacterized protein n=1 Tax=Acanthoscelides obtectus TaxID=200917 RepID=A0A9P0Q2K8_ACAOB|nr:unnamed protein product [Acanthoscelides obtectus]CAK1658272.1 Vesicular acetylcholine transporter unc-17 [Acanthoscelides obtectus]
MLPSTLQYISSQTSDTLLPIHFALTWHRVHSRMRWFVELNSENAATFVIVYLSFLLDNVLLTVVVPIIPDYLFSNDVNITSSPSLDPSHIGPASLSPLQRKYETLERDNGPLGALLASKAFVQLAFTPLIGYLIGRLGCNVPLLIGSCNMLLASICKFTI